MDNKKNNVKKSLVINNIYGLPDYFIVERVDVQTSSSIFKGEIRSDLATKNENMNKISSLLEIGYKI